MAQRAPVTFRGAILVRQAAYAALLVALVMAAATLNWFGAPAVRTYAVFFLTESMDVGDVVSRLGAWAAERGLDSRWLPWLQGEPKAEPPAGGGYPSGLDALSPGPPTLSPGSRGVSPGP